MMMKRILKWGGLLVLLALAGGLLAVYLVFTFPRNPSRWLALSPPTEQRASLAANWSDHEWRVFLRQDQARVARYSEFVALFRHGLSFRPPKDSGQSRLAEKHVYQVSDGWIVGYNAGEFGASVWWFSKKRMSRHKISDAQVVDYVTAGTNVFVLDGLAHLMSSRGQVLRLIPADGNRDWQLVPYAPLPEAPYAATAEKDGALLIITSSKLLRLRPDKTMEILINDGFWRGLSPNSIIEDAKGATFIGMRQGVARVPLTGASAGKVEWLVPNRKLLQDDLARLDMH